MQYKIVTIDLGNSTKDLYIINDGKDWLVKLAIDGREPTYEELIHDPDKLQIIKEREISINEQYIIMTSYSRDDALFKEQLRQSIVAATQTGTRVPGSAVPERMSIYERDLAQRKDEFGEDIPPVPMPTDEE